MPLPTEEPTNATPPQEKAPDLAPAIAFASRYLGEVKPEKPPKAEPEPPKTKPKAPKVKAIPAEDARSGFDEEKLGRVIGESIAKATKPEPPKEEPKPQPEVKEDRRTRVLRRMEKLHPERYKELADKTQANLKRLRQYADDWEAKHPGEKFDEDDEEHAEFKESLEKEVAYDDDDYVEAQADLLIDERESKKKDKEPNPDVDTLKRELSELKNRGKYEAAKNDIKNHVNGVARKFWEVFGDEYKSVIGDDGELNLKAIDSLRKADEDTFALLGRFAGELEAITEVLYCSKIEVPSGNQYGHRLASEYAYAFEDMMLARPPEDRLDENGRRFVTQDEYRSLGAEERKRVWKFSPDDVQFLVEKHYKNKASEALKYGKEKFERMAKRRGLLREETAPPPDHHPMLKAMRDREARLNQPDDEKPESPSAPIVPRMAPILATESSKPSNALEAFAARAIKGR